MRNVELKNLESFKKEILESIDNRPKQWRKGQFVFNYIEDTYGKIARKVMENGIDCFYDDSKIEKFIESCYNELKENGLIVIN